MNTIILAAGRIDYKKLPFGTHQSNSTIPINGKPVISWILDDLIKKNILNITIVIRKDNEKLYQLLQKYYNRKLKLNIIRLTEDKSIIYSLLSALKNNLNNSIPTRIVLGDTLLLDNYNIVDTLYISNVKNSENWCIIQKNSKKLKFFDKKKMDGIKFDALCGFYSFSDTQLLIEITKLCYESDEKELSSILKKYHMNIPFKVKRAKDWYDFGNLQSFIESKKSLLRPRHFNSLKIDNILNQVTKISDDNKKLKNELNWYKKLPNELKILTPRIIDENIIGDKIRITQEFYGYPSLSELYVFGDLSTSVWKSIISYLLKIHNIFLSYKTKSDKISLDKIYSSKVNIRLTDLKRQKKIWKSILVYENIIINGVKYCNLNQILSHLKKQIYELSERKIFNIIHGDFCLSNILYDLNSQIVRLIDPRGSFGKAGIYGDSRYDIAKLRHSISGGYDFIVADLFEVKQDRNKFSFDIYDDEKFGDLSDFLDVSIEQMGYNLYEIMLIEALLFTSMIPLHKDYFERQLAMYIKAVILLNNLKTKK